jgi:hypothetical protein
MDTPAERRLGSLWRGVVIAAMIVAYGWTMGLPQSSFTQMLVIGVLLQFLVILIRKFVPADQMARAQDVFELVADGVTVLCFALAVFGGIAKVPDGL